jgi:hypothetical protein
MGTNSFLGLISASQYSLFLGIAIVIFGWIEKKDRLILVGQAVFILLGILSAWVLLTKNIAIPLEKGTILTKEAKILGFFKLGIYFAVLNLISIILFLFKVRLYKPSLYLLVLVALALFFMVLNILQMPG